MVRLTPTSTATDVPSTKEKFGDYSCIACYNEMPRTEERTVKDAVLSR